MEKELSRGKIKIFKFLFIFTLLLIGTVSVSYIAVNKYETNKMQPSETQQLFDNIYIVRNDFVNFYLIKNDEGYIAIDAGISKEKTSEELYKLDIRPEEIHTVFLTHTDYDHVGSLELFDKAKVYMYAEEEQMINGKTKRSFLYSNKISSTYQTVKDLEIVECSNVNVQVIATPGHTPGSMSVLVDGKYLFVGDTLGFEEKKAALLHKIYSMDTKMQEESIRKLATQVEDTIEYIFTGHYGYLDDLKTVFQGWRNSEITADSPLYMQKFNTYVNIENHISTWLASNIQSYIEAYGNPNELSALSLAIMPMYYDRADEALKYTIMEPKFYLADQEMEELIIELKKTYDMMNELSNYYKGKTYQTDDNKGAKQLHDQFISQVDRLQENYEAFHGAFQATSSHVMGKNLEKYKDLGHLSNYYLMKCIMSAQAIEQYFFREEITDDTILKIGLGEYQRLYTTFKKDYNAYNNYIKSRKIKKEEQKHTVIASEHLSLELEGLVSAVDEITATKLGQKNIETMSISLVDEHLSKVIIEYNALVNAYSKNTLR